MSKFDLLSGVVSALRLRSELYFRADLSGAFALTVPAERRLIRFHYVRRGACLVRSGPDGAWHEIADGDLAIVPNGASHTIADRPDRRPVELPEILGAGAIDHSGVLALGSGGRRVQLLCGFCSFDEAIRHPVVSDLPGLIMLQSADIGAEPWVLAALRLLSLETDLDSQGTAGILSRVLEILFIQILRRGSPKSPDSGLGYLAALADPQLGRALRAMHLEPERGWSIAELARRSGMSRSRFAERFAKTVGVPPMVYLTEWRLSEARRLLRDTDLGIDEIAFRCGYASLPSFTRRYKAAFGIGPGGYRRAERRP
jgi:AraC family transcriptional regulator, alkane utilization regulator